MKYILERDIVRKRTALYTIGIVASAFPTLYFMFLISEVVHLFVRSGGHIWVSTHMLSGEPWLSFNAEGISFHVPILGFAISAISFFIFYVCSVLLIIEMIR